MEGQVELAARIRALLSERTGGPVDVHAVAPLAGGACQDLFGVDVTVGGEAQRLVLRSDAVRGLPGSIGRAEEYAVIGAAVRAGVPTPRARWLCHDLVRMGASAYFLDRIDGVTLGGKITRSPTLADARAKLPRQLASALGAIHRVTPDTDPELPVPRRPDQDPALVALDTLRESLDALAAPEPALEWALRWLGAHRPAWDEVTLVHGDYRTGNFVVGPQGLVGVLDWEFAHWGDPVEDLGWLCVRDWRFGAVSEPAGGITGRRAFCAAYTEATGRVVDPARLHWWEVLGNVSWALGARWQSRRYLSGEQDFELLVIGRRATEMAWEALRLITAGPERWEA